MEVDGDSKPAQQQTMCLRRRCERHKQWQRLFLEETRFQESEQADQMRALDKAEKELHAAAKRRWREEQSGRMESLGWVEMADA